MRIRSARPKSVSHLGRRIQILWHRFSFSAIWLHPSNQDPMDDNLCGWNATLRLIPGVYSRSSGLGFIHAVALTGPSICPSIVQHSSSFPRPPSLKTEDGDEAIASEANPRHRRTKLWLNGLLAAVMKANMGAGSIPRITSAGEPSTGRGKCAPDSHSRRGIHFDS
jgi:hypothetical protein